MKIKEGRWEIEDGEVIRTGSLGVECSFNVWQEVSWSTVSRVSNKVRFFVGQPLPRSTN